MGALCVINSRHEQYVFVPDSEESREYARSGISRDHQPYRYHSFQDVLSEPADRHRYRQFFIRLRIWIFSWNQRSSREDSIRRAYPALLKRFILPTAKTPINISSSLQKKLVEPAEDGDPKEMVTMVTKAHHEISYILEYGSFPRFQLSKEKLF